MNMKIWLVGFATIGLCSVSQASQSLLCKGSYLSYKITITANLDRDKQVDGSVHVAVKGPNLDTAQDLEVTSSDIQTGSHIKVSGRNETGSGTIEATKYNEDKKTYSGKLSGEGGSLGSLKVNVTCGIGNFASAPQN